MAFTATDVISLQDELRPFPLFYENYCYTESLNSFKLRFSSRLDLPRVKPISFTIQTAVFRSRLLWHKLLNEFRSYKACFNLKIEKF